MKEKKMHKTFAIFGALLVLAACEGETESSCLTKLNEMMNAKAVGGGVYAAEANLITYLKLMEIQKNPDLNVCDYTVLDWQIVKID
jgi:hypothetical protein